MLCHSHYYIKSELLVHEFLYNKISCTIFVPFTYTHGYYFISYHQTAVSTHTCNNKSTRFGHSFSSQIIPYVSILSNLFLTYYYTSHVHLIFFLILFTKWKKKNWKLFQNIKREKGTTPVRERERDNEKIK